MFPSFHRKVRQGRREVEGKSHSRSCHYRVTDSQAVQRDIVRQRYSSTSLHRNKTDRKVWSKSLNLPVFVDKGLPLGLPFPSPPLSSGEVVSTSSTIWMVVLSGVWASPAPHRPSVRVAGTPRDITSEHRVPGPFLSSMCTRMWGCLSPQGCPGLQWQCSDFVCAGSKVTCESNSYIWTSLVRFKGSQAGRPLHLFGWTLFLPSPWQRRRDFEIRSSLRGPEHWPSWFFLQGY